MHITQISLIFVSLCAGAAFAVVASAPVVADSAASQAFVAKALAAGRCWAVDTEVDKDGALLSGAPDAPLAPGRYRLHVLLSRAPLGDRFSNAVEVTIKVGDVAQRVNPLRYALPNEFIHMPVDFSVKPGDRDTGFAINWRVSPEAKKLHKTGGAAMVEAGPDDDNLIPDVIVNRPKTANDGTISVRDLPALPYNLAVSGVHIERLCPVRTTVRADKVVYKPGETGTATVTLTNTGNTPATVTLTVEVLAGLDGKKPVATQKLEIPAAGEKTWSGPFFTVGMRWGAEVRATVTADDERADDARAVFAVSHNPYEVAMFAAQGPNLGLGWKDPADAERRVLEWREAGFTGAELFFWAPCDFGDFTPHIEDFFSGQTQYTHSVSGTKNLLAALHKHGMAGAVYSNLWGTDGASGFELLRKHPEWFAPNVQYASDYIEFWRLMEEKKVTTMHQWCETWLVQDEKVTADAIDHHAKELVESHTLFGWDAVRYDTYISSPWTKWATRKTRDQVGAVVPAYQFGYNTFPGTDAKVGALDAMYDGGGMAMLEYIRQEHYQRLADYAGQLWYCRDIVWPSGGQIGPLYRHPSPPDTKPTTASDIDALYVSAVVLACGGHPYYHPLESELGHYPRFALRYAEYLWNNRMRVLKDPAAVISFGNGATPFLWEKLAQTVTLDGQRRRLVLHLLNVDPQYTLFTNLDQKMPPPLRNLPIRLNLPAGAQMTGAWNLCPVPDAHHERLETKQEGGTITLAVPEVRFWNVVVVDYTAPQPLPERINTRQITETCIQDWYIAGPFPNTGRNCPGYDAVYPPEKGVDLAATYTGKDEARVRWQRTRKAGKLALGGGMVDFIGYYPPGTNACAYAYTKVTADRDREALLLVGSDDTVQIWLNGTSVHANRVFRAASLDDDRVPITLKKGENTILVKVCSGGGGWEFVLRLAEKDGSPMTDGVQYGFEK